MFGKESYHCTRSRRLLAHYPGDSSVGANGHFSSPFEVLVTFNYMILLNIPILIFDL